MSRSNFSSYKYKGPFIYFFLLAIVIIGAFSCRTVREIPAEKIKPVSKEKLIRRIEKNILNYDDLTISRMNCHFKSSNTKQNFRIQLKALRDEKILISISKVNIPVGRILLTPDTVKYINYIEKNFYLGDYSFFTGLLNINLDFNTIQSIISNNVLSYFTDDNIFSKFDSSVENGKYILYRPVYNNLILNNRDKSDSYVSVNETNGFQKIIFNPYNFTLEKLIINDLSNDSRLEAEFSDYVEIAKKNYPGNVNISFFSINDNIELAVRLNGISIKEIDNINVTIPEKYDQIYINKN